MKKLAFLVAAASLFAVAPFAERFGPVASSVALVWMSVLVAIFASGFVNGTAVASGALGAFGSGVLAAVSPAAAGAVLLGSAFAERTTRVRSRTARAVHVLLALVGGGLAGSLATAFAASSVPVFAVAVVCAAVLAAAPLLVEADDPVAHALARTSSSVAEPAKASLLEAAELRRTAADVPLDRATSAHVRKTWQSLLRLAEARARLERTRPKVLVRVATPAPAAPAASDEARASEARADEAPSDEAPASPAPASALPSNPADQVLAMLDERIADHVAVLGRAYTAVDTARAAAVGIDDSALQDVESMGDSLEEVSRALAEVDAKGARA
jgi:hypothetical protein